MFNSNDLRTFPTYKDEYAYDYENDTHVHCDGVVDDKVIAAMARETLTVGEGGWTRITVVLGRTVGNSSLSPIVRMTESFFRTGYSFAVD